MSTGNGYVAVQDTQGKSNSSTAGASNQGAEAEKLATTNAGDRGNSSDSRLTGLVKGLLDQFAKMAGDTDMGQALTGGKGFTLFGGSSSDSGQGGYKAAPYVMILGGMVDPAVAETGLETAVARTIGKAPEFSGGTISESGFLRSAATYLKDGYKELSAGRYVSSDGLRQVRFGAHETRSIDTLHAHFEAFDRPGGKIIENTSVKIIPDTPP